MQVRQSRTMRRANDLPARALLAVLFAYFVLGGATSNAMLNLRYKLVTGLLVTVGVVLWLVVRRRWHWHQTALDSVLWLWVAAFGLSLLANTDSWRRVAIGLWYVGCYIGAWYILHDLLANRLLRRETLVDLLLIAGAAVLIFGYAQYFAQLGQWQAMPPQLREPFFNAVRAAAPLDNPNMMASFMVMLLPFAAVRALSASRWPARLLMGGYALLAALLGMLSFSRAGWIGLAAMAAAFGLLGMAHQGWLSVRRFTAWARIPSMRPVLIGAVVLGVAAIAAGVLLLVSITGSTGRQLDLRTYLYDTALQMFREKPLTGHGLFTYGSGVLRLNSVPNQIAHAHAHSLVLNLAAELGLFGLAAAGVSFVILAIAIRRNWRAMPRPDRPLLVAAIAALIGVGTQHLFDFTATMALIALVIVLVIVLAAAPLAPVRVTRRRGPLQTLALTALSVALLATGLWSNRAYSAYVDALFYGFLTPDFKGAGERMQAAVDSDPALPVYSFYQGTLYGMAAFRGESDALQPALAAYRRFVALEANFSPAWADLSALLWQEGAREEAIQAMLRAEQIAPTFWGFPVNLGQYYEVVGEAESARVAYRRGLERWPDAALYPFWQETALRRELLAEGIQGTGPARLSGLAQVIRALDSGPLAEAEAALQAADTSKTLLSSRLLIELYIALQKNDRDTAARLVATLERGTAQPDTDLPVALGRALLAAGTDQAASTLQAVRDRLDPIGILDADYVVGPYMLAQHLRLSVPPLFLPQLFLPRTAPEVAWLIERLETF